MTQPPIDTSTLGPIKIDPTNDRDLIDARHVVARWRIGYGEAIRRGEAFQEMVEAVRMGIAFARHGTMPPRG